MKKQFKVIVFALALLSLQGLIAQNFFVVNRQTGKKLAPQNGNDAAELIQLDASNTSDIAKWTQVNTSNGFFYLRNVSTGKYFRPATDGDGSKLEQRPTSFAGFYTQWEKVNSSNGYFYLKNRQTKLYFRPNTDGNNSTMVQRPTSFAGNYTQWKFVETTGGSGGTTGGNNGGNNNGGNNNGGNNGGAALAVSCAGTPATIPSSSSISIPVTYTHNASGNKDIFVVAFQNGAWKGNGSAKTVAKGTNRTINVTLNINPAPTGTGWSIKSIIRPTASGFVAPDKECSKNVTISGGNNNGGNNNGGGNIGSPQTSDTGCTGQPTRVNGANIVPGGNGWRDSYSAGGFCFCNTTYDHKLDEVNRYSIRINGVNRGLRAICGELTKHPRYRNQRNGDPIYNTIQCGNGPAHTDFTVSVGGRAIQDEVLCPGRVDQGVNGCQCKGPKFDMKWLSSRTRFGGSGKALNTTSNGGSFAIAPVPATVGGDTFLDIEIKTSALATVSIYSISGKFIAAVKANVIEGTTESIDISGLINAAGAAGAYVITYSDGNTSKSEIIAIK